MRWMAVVVALAFWPLGALGQDGVVDAGGEPPRAGEVIKGQPYRRCTTVDRFGRTIDFCVSEAEGDGPLPLVVYIQGSGNQSNFCTVADGRIASTNGHIFVQRAARGRARVVIVEKPGVAFLESPERPGSAESTSKEFLAEHTLERWAEAVSAAMRAAQRLPGIDATRTLVAGHSEGGLVACAVAARNPSVTHVVNLAGGGVTQLFDLIELARAGHMYGPASADPEERVRLLLEGWREVQADPMSTGRFWLGHPHRRWSTFLASSPLEELSGTSARVLLVQGVEDRAVSVASFDVLYAQLLAKGRDVTAWRLEGADHSFAVEGEKPGEGFKRVMERMIDWYLGPAPQKAGKAGTSAP